MLRGKVKRYMSEKITSVEDEILSYQEGQGASKIATAYTYIPCGMETPIGVQITPVKLSTISANGVAFNTTTGVVEIVSLSVFNVATDLDVWADGVVYQVGTLVLHPDGVTAYICCEAHTSATGGASDTADFAVDVAKWQSPNTDKFLKLTHTSAGSGKVANFSYLINGYKDN